MYYKLGQARVTNWGSFVLLQIRTNVVINWGSFIIANPGKCCYQLGQLLQIRATINRAAITNWGKIYYKLGQVLQIRAIITNWGITAFIKKYSTVPDQCKISNEQFNFYKMMYTLKIFYTLFYIRASKIGP